MADPTTPSGGGVQYRVTPECLVNAATNTGTTASETAGRLTVTKRYGPSSEAEWQGIAYNQFRTLMQ